MISLRHLAVLKLTETQRYDGNDPIIEHVIFDVEQLRMKLEDRLMAHRIRRPRRRAFRFSSKRYTELMDALSVELFDVFTYDHMISTPSHVLWKEYFHALYEFVIVDVDNSYHLIVSTIRYYSELEKPEMVDTDDPCYGIINRILRYFDGIRAEQEALEKRYSMELEMKTGVEYGMKLVEWTNEWKVLLGELDVYEKIIDWSLR